MVGDSKQTFAVYAGISRGGFGDIAANLEMALLLQQHYPEVFVTLLVDKHNQRTIEQLLKLPVKRGVEFDYYSSTHGVSIRVVHLSGKRPKADMLFCFSLEHFHSLNNYGRLQEVAPVRFYCKEYGHSHTDRIIVDNAKQYYLINSGINSAGWYIGSYPLFTLQESELRRSLEHLYNEPLLADSVPPIFLYFPHRMNRLDLYLESVYRLLDRTGVGNACVIAPGQSGKTKKGVRLLDANLLPYNLFPSVIEHATGFPIVRGNVSLTQACSLHRPFSYDNLQVPDTNSNIKQLFVRLTKIAQRVVPTTELHDVVEQLGLLLLEQDMFKAIAKGFNNTEAPLEIRGARSNHGQCFQSLMLSENDYVRAKYDLAVKPPDELVEIFEQLLVVMLSDISIFDLIDCVMHLHRHPDHSLIVDQVKIPNAALSRILRQVGSLVESIDDVLVSELIGLLRDPVYSLDDLKGQIMQISSIGAIISDRLRLDCTWLSTHGVRDDVCELPLVIKQYLQRYEVIRDRYCKEHEVTFPDFPSGLRILLAHISHHAREVLNSSLNDAVHQYSRGIGMSR